MSEHPLSENVTSEKLLLSIRVVLVNTSHPGNIGGAARAMKNMGLSQLYLVAPKDYPADRAQWRAAGALDVLEGATVVETLDEAIADCGLVVGTSARGRRIPWPIFTPREFGERAVAEASVHDVAVVFGREDRGLTNEELHKCHYHVHIPSNPSYSSLNLAAAVQVLSYEIRMATLTLEDGKAPHFDDWDVPPAKQKDLEMYFEHLEKAMIAIGFYSPDNPRQTMTRMRRLYNRIRLDEMELNIMRGMLTAIQNFVHRTKQDVEKASRSEKDNKSD